MQSDDSGRGAEWLLRLNVACYFLWPLCTFLAFIIGGPDIGLAVGVWLGLFCLFVFLGGMAYLMVVDMVVEPLRRMRRNLLARRALADLAFRLASAQGPASPVKARLAREVAAALDIRSDRPAS